MLIIVLFGCSSFLSVCMLFLVMLPVGIISYTMRGVGSLDISFSSEAVLLALWFLVVDTVSVLGLNVTILWLESCRMWWIMLLFMRFSLMKLICIRVVF